MAVKLSKDSNCQTIHLFFNF